MGLRAMGIIISASDKQSMLDRSDRKHLLDPFDEQRLGYAVIAIQGDQPTIETGPAALPYEWRRMPHGFGPNFRQQQNASDSTNQPKTANHKGK